MSFGKSQKGTVARLSSQCRRGVNCSMKIGQITSALESIAPLSLQEEYDNAGLLTGSLEQECTGVLCTLDVTEEVVQEALNSQCNCIVAHHPVIFRGLKRLTGGNEVERV